MGGLRDLFEGIFGPSADAVDWFATRLKDAGVAPLDERYLAATLAITVRDGYRTARRGQRFSASEPRRLMLQERLLPGELPSVAATYESSVKGPAGSLVARVLAQRVHERKPAVRTGQTIVRIELAPTAPSGVYDAVYAETARIVRVTAMRGLRDASAVRYAPFRSAVVPLGVR
jgi:hypothetical protein